MTMQKSKLLNSLVAIALLSGASMSASYAAEAATPAAPAQSTQLAANAAVTDEAITSSAKAALGADPQLAALPVSVSVKKGVVLLSGEVPSAEAGDRVVQLVASVAGVKEVKNDLKVKAAG
ncbi:BON domain-containing protein [Janthinobacterium fluminis]|uniref:BON domain-containing protein n=1 Tax=Janthinobacterium fluminis TaxID=2987524 RepID=A0ABT5JYR9_9BURK|nr:BON domain-containing protein [Janthinobacterium fluminis]MDC8757880.1 BON domain-containing protein [Janthinobacterium fluminis]